MIDVASGGLASAPAPLHAYKQANENGTDVGAGPMS